MTNNFRKKSILIVVLAVFLMACSLTGLLPGRDKDTASSGEYRSEVGGYSFKPIEGYELIEFFGITQMMAPGGNAETGPMIAMMGAKQEEKLDNQKLLGNMKESLPDAKFSKPKKVKVDGKAGLDIKLEDYEDEDVMGRLVIVMVEPTQHFVLLGVAPKAEWKTLNKNYEKVLKSIKFFEPKEMSFDEDIYDDGYIVSPDDFDFEPGQFSTYDEDGQLHQWAVSAVASSQYGDEGWSAKQAVGEPDVEDCQDDIFAWASSSSNTVEWIELTYETPVIPFEVTVVQSYNPSQVVDITVIAEDGTEFSVYEGSPETTQYCPAYLTVSIETTAEIYVNKVRITIDQSELGLGWNEIDAVELVGMPRLGSYGPTDPTPFFAGGMDFAGDVPEGKGFLTTGPYRKYLSVPINEVVALEPIIGPLKSSSGGLKPRADHKDTYVFDIGGDMKAYVSITTSGLVYKKTIGPVNQVDMGVEFDSDTYDQLAQLQKDMNYQLPYTLVAQILGSPGLIIWDQIQDDGSRRTEYYWFNSKGDAMWVAAYNGLITGYAGISFMPKN
ncbi:MAG TPA: hypothetical protein PLX29_06740 [Anaerolineaceae bacterium]|nr:hypothetical protein [Anaerolineaceae bacterium]